ncbi:MAG: adenosylcobinamide-GDP ribazoletransferase [Fervidicoccaceae archaeon]
MTPIPVPREYVQNKLEFGSLFALPIIGSMRGAFVSIPLLTIFFFHIGSPDIAAFSVIAMHYVMQGFIHADGFIDFSEAALAKRFGADARKVLKDRYRGSYAIAIFSIFSLWLYSALLSIVITTNPLKAISLVVSAEAWSPTSMILTSLLSAEPPEGMGRAFKRGADSKSAAISLIISSTITIFLFREFRSSLFLILLSFISILLSSAISSALGRRVLGYANGDVLGFSNELSYAVLLTSFVLGASPWI